MRSWPPASGLVYQVSVGGPSSAAQAASVATTASASPAATGVRRRTGTPCHELGLLVHGYTGPTLPATGDDQPGRSDFGHLCSTRASLQKSSHAAPTHS